jgi:hypothetical protein
LTTLQEDIHQIVLAEHNEEGNWRQSSEGKGLRAGMISPKYPRILSYSFTNVGEILRTGKCALAPGVYP